MHSSSTHADPLTVNDVEEAEKDKDDINNTDDCLPKFDIGKNNDQKKINDFMSNIAIGHTNDLNSTNAKQKNVLLHDNIRMDDGAQGGDQIGSHIISPMAQHGDSSGNSSHPGEPVDDGDGSGNSSHPEGHVDDGDGSGNSSHPGGHVDGQSTTADTQVRNNVLILHTKPSCPEAIRFGKHLKSEVVDVDVSIDEYAMLGKKKYGSIHAAVDRYDYIFAYVSEDLYEDADASYRQQLALLVDIKYVKKDKVIPVYPTETLCDKIPEFKVLFGMKYYDFLEGRSSTVNAYRESVQRLFEGDATQGLLRHRGRSADGDGSGNSSHPGGHVYANSSGRTPSEDQLRAVGGVSDHEDTFVKREATGKKQEPETEPANPRKLLLLHTDKDWEEANSFRTDLENGNFNGVTVNITFHSEYKANTSYFRLMSGAFDDFDFVLVFVTQNLKNDGMLLFMTELSLDASLTGKGAKDRLLPVWTRESKCDIVCLEPIIGLNYRSPLAENRTLRTVLENLLSKSSP